MRNPPPTLIKEQAIKEYFPVLFQKFTTLPYQCKCGDRSTTGKVNGEPVTRAIMSTEAMIFHVRKAHGRKVRKPKEEVV